MSHIHHQRRNSSASPYSVASKHPHKHSHHYHHHHHHHHHTPGQKLSAAVPSLPRNLVVRRISEGESGRLKELLNCEACGKGYKHISSLAKHLWEHTPEWNMTKKLLISKHQQVQLLEAASILVSMTEPEEAEASEKLRFSDSFDPSKEYAVDVAEATFIGRSHSISEYPPALIPSTYSPMPGYVGGYIDVPKPKKKTVAPASEASEDAISFKLPPSPSTSVAVSDSTSVSREGSSDPLDGKTTGDEDAGVPENKSDDEVAGKLE